MKDDKTVDKADIPILSYLEKKLSKQPGGIFGKFYQESLRQGFVDMLGDVEFLRVLRVSNWLRTTLLADDSWANKPHTAQNHALMDKTVVCSVASTHALTLCMADKHKVTLQEAFKMLRKYKRNTSSTVDVDLECLTLLESRMFTQGRQVWGKGKGIGEHQDGWDPAEGIGKPGKREKQQQTAPPTAKRRRKGGSAPSRYYDLHIKTRWISR